MITLANYHHYSEYIEITYSVVDLKNTDIIFVHKDLGEVFNEHVEANPISSEGITLANYHQYFESIEIDSGIADFGNTHLIRVNIKVGESINTVMLSEPCWLEKSSLERLVWIIDTYNKYFKINLVQSNNFYLKDLDNLLNLPVKANLVPSGRFILESLKSICPAMEQIVACPVCGPQTNRKNLSSIVQELNDNHKWTREQIADWLETTDLDIILRKEELEEVNK